MQLGDYEDADEVNFSPLTPFFLMQSFSVLTRSAHSGVRVVDSFFSCSIILIILI